MDPMDLVRAVTQALAGKQSLGDALGLGKAADIFQQGMKQAQAAQQKMEAEIQAAQQRAAAAQAGAAAAREKTAAAKAAGPAPPAPPAPVETPPEPFPEGPLTLVPAKTAAEICRNYELSPEAKARLDNKQTPRQFLDRLLADELFPDALRFLANALPLREAIWWACLCQRLVLGPVFPEALKVPLKAAVRWVLDPSEENRRATQKIGETLGLGCPAGAVALAAFWSGGSLTAPDLPTVPPPAGLPARAAASAVLLAAAQTDPAKILFHQRRFIILGIGVAQETVHWKFSAGLEKQGKD